MGWYYTLIVSNPRTTYRKLLETAHEFVVLAFPLRASLFAAAMRGHQGVHEVIDFLLNNQLGVNARRL